MKLTFLGKESKVGDSPTLYATDRDTYIVQGYKIPPADGVTVPDGYTAVAIYDRLLDHLAKDGVPAGAVRREPPIIAGGDDESCIIQGRTVTDDDIRRRIRLPGHEDCVEIPKTELAALLKDPREADQQRGA